MPLSEIDAGEIADRFLEAARGIDDYLDSHWENISRSEYETMSESARTLLRVSSFLTTEAVQLSIDQMEDAAMQLKQVITDAKESLGTLQNIRTAIRVAAGLVDLATAIMSRDPGAVLKAFQGLYELVQEQST